MMKLGNIELDEGTIEFLSTAKDYIRDWSDKAYTDMAASISIEDKTNLKSMMLLNNDDSERNTIALEAKQEEEKPMDLFTLAEREFNKQLEDPRHLIEFNTQEGVVIDKIQEEMFRQYYHILHAVYNSLTFLNTY